MLEFVDDVRNPLVVQLIDANFVDLVTNRPESTLFLVLLIGDNAKLHSDMLAG